MKCNGITTPSATASADFTISHKTASDTIVIGKITGVALGLADANTPTNVVLVASIALKKTTDAGLHTSYVFNIKNTGTAFLTDAYYIIVEFST